MSKMQQKIQKKSVVSEINFIWIGMVKLYLLRNGYFSLAANVLTSSPKIWHVNKRRFRPVNWFGSDQWIWSRCCDTDFRRALARLPCCLSTDALQWDSLDFYPTTFSVSVISKIQNLWRSPFFQNILNLS